MISKYLKNLLAALSVALIFLTIGTFVANKANADTPFPSGAITATYNSATRELNASGNYAWSLCNSTNKKKWAGFALFINGAFPSSSTPDSRALDGTGMHLANGGNACTTDPGSWSDTHILTSAPTSVCVVVYDVEINTGAPNVGDRSETGAGKDFNEDNSYHNNGDSYATENCTVPTVTSSSTPTPTETPSNDKGGGGNPGPSSCADQKPGAGPFNLYAVAGPGAGQVTLHWEPAQGSVTGYAISYSDDPNNKKYGVANAGNVTSLTISDLAVTKYYFWVTPLNGCAPGEPIGPVSVGGTGGPIKAVLGLSSTGSDQNLILYFAQIFAAFALSIVGFQFFKKNA